MFVFNCHSSIWLFLFPILTYTHRPTSDQRSVRVYGMHLTVQQSSFCKNQPFPHIICQLSKQAFQLLEDQGIHIYNSSDTSQTYLSMTSRDDNRSCISDTKYATMDDLKKRPMHQLTLQSEYQDGVKEVHCVTTYTAVTELNDEKTVILLSQPMNVTFKDCSILPQKEYILNPKDELSLVCMNSRGLTETTNEWIKYTLHEKWQLDLVHPTNDSSYVYSNGGAKLFTGDISAKHAGLFVCQTTVKSSGQTFIRNQTIIIQMAPATPVNLDIRINDGEQQLELQWNQGILTTNFHIQAIPTKYYILYQSSLEEKYEQQFTSEIFINIPYECFNAATLYEFRVSATNDHGSSPETIRYGYVPYYAPPPPPIKYTILQDDRNALESSIQLLKAQLQIAGDVLAKVTRTDLVEEKTGLAQGEAPRDEIIQTEAENREL